MCATLSAPARGIGATLGSDSEHRRRPDVGEAGRRRTYLGTPGLLYPTPAVSRLTSGQSAKPNISVTTHPDIDPSYWSSHFRVSVTLMKRDTADIFAEQQQLCVRALTPCRLCGITGQPFSGLQRGVVMPTRQQIIIHERHKLAEEQQRIAGELERLREALKIEVDVDAEEGDPDLIEREKNVALVGQLEGQLARRPGRPALHRQGPLRHLRTLRQGNPHRTPRSATGCDLVRNVPGRGRETDQARAVAARAARNRVTHERKAHGAGPWQPARFVTGWDRPAWDAQPVFSVSPTLAN